MLSVFWAAWMKRIAISVKKKKYIFIMFEKNQLLMWCS